MSKGYPKPWSSILSKMRRISDANEHSDGGRPKKRVKKVDHHKGDEMELGCHLSLPEELWLKVFSSIPLPLLVSVVSRVCRRWHALTKEHVLWRKLVHGNNPLSEWYGGGQADAAVLRHLKRHPHVEEVDLSDSNCSDIALEAIAGCAEPNQLRSLCLSRCFGVSMLHFGRFKRCGGSLARLEIANGRYEAWALCQLPQLFPLLSHVDVGMCWNLNDDVLVAFAKGWPNLKSIRLAKGHSPWVTGRGIRAISMGCPLLEDVVIDQCAGVDGASLLVMAKHCHRIRRLHLKHLTSVVDDEVAIAFCRPSLQELNLIGCYRITGATLLVVGSNCPMLTCMKCTDVGNLTFNILEQFLMGCPHVVDLDLSNCGPVSGDELAQLIATHAGGLRRLHCRHKCPISSPTSTAAPISTASSSGATPLHKAKGTHTATPSKPMGSLGVDHLCTLPYLMVLDFSGAHVEFVHFRRIVEACKHLTKVYYLYGNADTLTWIDWLEAQQSSIQLVEAHGHRMSALEYGVF